MDVLSYQVRIPHVLCIFDECMHDTNYWGDEYLQADINDVMEKIAPSMKMENQYHSPGPKHIEFGLSLGSKDYPAEKWTMLNTDAHLKSSIFGSPSLTFIVKDGEIQLGALGKVYFVDWDQLRETNKKSTDYGDGRIKMKIISPSLLNSDTYQIKEQFEALEKCGINYIHIDITDGHFVPMISFGANTVKDLRKHTDFVLDCHLMVENPENLIPVIANAGADIITVHTEATKHIYRSIQTIKKCGKKAGIAINPGTPVSMIKEILANG